MMLLFGCFFLTGSYYCFDNPSVIQSTLEKEPYNLSSSKYGYLYEVYSLPNCVLPLFGGIFLDKIGVR